MTGVLSPAASVRDQVSEVEWRARVELAAVFRLVALEGWSELAVAHASARIPGTANEFLFLPAELTFEEITASSLQKIDGNGDLLMPSPYERHKFAYALQMPTYERFSQANCIIHLHTVAGTAVSMQKDGLLPSSQYALWLGPVSYMDYGGHVASREEGERLAAAFGNNQFLMMRCHGTMNWGETIGQAYILAWILTRACEKQLMAQAGQSELYRPPADVIAKTPVQARSVTAPDGPFGLQNWAAALRRAGRHAPGYDS
jgi:ribulose-5-phosphate 4-epimerase/fuculose-1-phosphate aldolase